MTNFISMKKYSGLNLSIIVFVFALFSGCKKDNKKLTPSCDGSKPTFTNGVKSIIDSKCASSGCHPGYSTYNGIKGITQNGDFTKEVLNDQSMPKNSSLSQDQINTLQCWANNGFPE